MSLEEVADLLGGAASRGPGAEDSALLAKQVAQTLLELEAGLMTSSGGKHAAKQSRANGSQLDGQALEDMMEGLLHQASRYQSLIPNLTFLCSCGALVMTLLVVSTRAKGWS